MADERDRLRMQLGLEPLSAEQTATPTPVVDERTQMQAMQTAAPLSGAERAAATIQARNDRFAAELAAREASRPTTDPGEGNIWSYSVAEGRWKRVNVAGGFGGTGSSGSTGLQDGFGAGLSGSGQNQDSGNAAILAQLQAFQQTQQAAQQAQEKAERQSAYDLLYSQFAQYGLQGLIEPLKDLIQSGVSPAEFTIRLRDTDAYKKRFAANQARVQKGLRALSEAEYIGLEDQYQDVMRRYGLPENYYSRGDMGRQEGFEKFIGGDVSPVELEDRIQTAQRRVINAAPEVTASLRQFYPEIGQGDLLAYFLDPDKAIENIKRKVTAAEIGGAATMSGLASGVTRAEELASFGVTGEQARQGFQTVAEVLPRGSQLASIYRQDPYTQTTAEQEVFGLTGAPEAARQRRKLTQLEQASFSGSSGAAGGALGRERAGAF